MADNYDSENTNLVSSPSKKEKKKPDWSRFGLSQEQAKASETSLNTFSVDKNEALYQHTDGGKHNELFTEDLVSKYIPTIVISLIKIKKNVK